MEKEKEKGLETRRCLLMTMIGSAFSLSAVWGYFTGSSADELVGSPFNSIAVYFFVTVPFLFFLKTSYGKEVPWTSFLKETKLAPVYACILLGALAVTIEIIVAYFPDALFTAPRAWEGTTVDIPCAIVIGCCCIIALATSVIRYIKEYKLMAASRKAIRAMKRAGKVPTERPTEKKVRGFLLATITCSALALLALWAYYFGISPDQRTMASFSESPFFRSGVFLVTGLAFLLVLKRDRNDDDYWITFLKETKLASVLVPCILGFLLAAAQCTLLLANNFNSTFEGAVASTPCAIAIACCCAVAIIASLIRMIRGISASKQAT